MEDLKVNFIGYNDLLKNKKQSGRPVTLMISIISNNYCAQQLRCQNWGLTSKLQLQLANLL